MPIPLTDSVLLAVTLPPKVKKPTLSVKQSESDAELDWARH
jgi:hypothetical protein